MLYLHVNFCLNWIELSMFFSRRHGTLHLAVSVGMSVDRCIGRSVTFLNSRQLSHYCSCSTIRDYPAEYPALPRECFHGMIAT